MFFVIWPFSINRFSTFFYSLFSRSRSLSILWLFTLPFVSSLPESSLVFYSLASSSSFFLFLFFFFFFFFFTVSTFWKEEAEQARRTRREKREEGGRGERERGIEAEEDDGDEGEEEEEDGEEGGKREPASLPAGLLGREREGAPSQEGGRGQFSKIESKSEETYYTYIIHFCMGKQCSGTILCFRPSSLYDPSLLFPHPLLVYSFFSQITCSQSVSRLFFLFFYASASSLSLNNFSSSFPKLFRQCMGLAS